MKDLEFNTFYIFFNQFNELMGEGIIIDHSKTFYLIHLVSKNIYIVVKDIKENIDLRSTDKQIFNVTLLEQLKGKDIFEIIHNYEKYILFGEEE